MWWWEAAVTSGQIKTDTETKMDLVKAETEATATEKRAQAAKVRAEATKAETAALGLAEADVEAVSQLKQDASFRMVGDLLIGPILNLLGLK
ncbi:MAG: hypothetical protein GY803_00315, partial [Chloroflexi bacterium]|nr:hypothetical protein [Chloroflexota bacterium]